jgi:hypothetical protein
MNKIDRKMAAWKAQQAMEVAAEEARLARLETYIDLELQQINQQDQADKMFQYEMNLIEDLYMQGK